MPKNTKAFYFIVLLLIVLALPGCGKKPDNETIVPEESQASNENQSAAVDYPTGEYTINELLTMNKPLKCTWKESLTGAGEVTNVIYISGQKFYQDVTMGDMGHAYTISDGEYLYIWNDFTNTASKMNFQEMQKISQPDSGSVPPANTNTMEQARNFVCEKWSVDNSLFTLPGDKNFQDLTKEMGQAAQDLQKNSAQNKNQACDFCRQAPTQELIDECLENAQCAE
ncbi:MAG TPA: hypothetical protein PLR18_02940 [bacterium]|nr:hypothetical protein [bacterium]